MARRDKLRQHLPSLYRPEPGEESLLNHFLDALGFSMDQAQALMTQIMQSHWFAYADKASYDEHAARDRERRGLPPFNVKDADDQLEIALYPYIEDLARLGKLITVAPWKEPPDQRDRVENYRRRMTKIMQIYRRGLGTIDALRTMVEAELPWALENPLAERIRSFAIEEGQSSSAQTHAVVMNGAPADKVGALMRWHLSRGDAFRTQPTLLIHGIDAVSGETEVTEQPMIESYAPQNTGLIGVAIAYDNTLAPGDTLRLQPTRRSWITSADGLHASPLANDGNAAADPSANGPWETLAGTPTIAFDCVHRTDCGSLWLSGAQQLWRYDGSDFTRILDTETFADIHHLAEVNGWLYLGCDDGLFRLALYPGDGIYSLEELTDLSGVAVYQILVEETNLGSEIWLATENGPCQMSLAPDQTPTIEPVLFSEPTYALCFHAQIRYFGCEAGLLRQDLASQQWHLYRGETEEEPQLQWLNVETTALPGDESRGLPPIRSIAITPDQALWLGSDAGLCRYVARHERDLLYRAVLEAYPDLITGVVHQLHTDDRGMLWIATEVGLFRYDGRDLAQYLTADSRWQQLGRADALYPNDLVPEARGQWRYNNIEEQWEQFDSRGRRWSNSALASRSETLSPVSQIVLTPAVQGHLGSWDGSQFTASAEVPPEQLRMRCKPDPQVIVDGGPAFIPPLESGQSTWRYLQLEVEPVTPPAAEGLPWWSREGRLFPPPDMQDVYPGRYRSDNLAVDGRFDESVFAYLPSAAVTMIYSNPLALDICVRLFRRSPQDAIDPAILDRVMAGIEKVRPAGIPVNLAVEGLIVKGASL